ncbi:MAG: PAS domain S-box protein, partial [Spirochaetaceae bacterium]
MHIDESQIQSEGIFQGIVENLQDGIIIVQDQKLAYCNPSVSGLTGYSMDDLLNGEVGFLSPQSIELLVSRYQDRVEGRPVPQIYEIEILQKGGGAIPVELNLSKVSYHGRPAVLGIARDISKRKAFEEELLNSEQRFRALIENVPVAIWVTAKNGKTVYISPNVEQIYGYTVQEILAGGDTFWFDRLFPDDRDKVIQAFGELFSANVPFNIEYRIQRKDGAWIWLYDRAKIVMEKGPEAFAYGVFSDITEQKQMVQQFQQAEKMQAIGQLAGGVAHDFNNQLAGILGYADLLRDGAKDNPELSHYADNIIMAVKRAADLTSQLLAFSRKGKYLSITVDMHQTILEVVSILRHSIDKRITIEQELAASPSTTIGDPSQLQSAILNCAINARDAMPDGGVLGFFTKVVTLDEEFCKKIPYEIPSGEYLQISIEDSGIGMDEGTVRHIFEPFFTTKERGKGTGMGLASTYGTIRNHRGAIHVTTTPGKGTTFN